MNALNFVFKGLLVFFLSWMIFSCGTPAPKGPPVHPGSQAALAGACETIQKEVGYVLTGQKVLPGLTLGEVSTDAGLCEFGGSTIALNLFYSQDGTLLVIR